MSYFDHLAGLVKFNSNMTSASFKPVFKQHWPESLIDDMISREISVLGLHHASMREALQKDTPTGRTALAQPQIVEVLPRAPPPPVAPPATERTETSPAKALAYARRFAQNTYPDFGAGSLGMREAWGSGRGVKRKREKKRHK